ncbi:hypothetical protein J4E83_010406 [Alternaria metachromatica]|uniref:uncharacterized protein n=1 Tax=Alternaria metachromatica TaxID=283354 RepID=UPI0020C23319|nr:uncharacterized protein J4E83_010406 [Alternaria metachromatica]KAI4605743.1 hypothetical protein J4E83_010406 [Alternaria metachromatica]
MVTRLSLAEELVKDHPKKTIELLMDYLQDKEIRATTERYIWENPARRSPETALEHRHEASPPRAHRRNPSAPQGPPRYDVQSARYSVQTPPTSAGSVKSHGSGLTAAGMEKITFLSCDDEIPDQTVIARNAPGRYNLIDKEVADSRGLNVDPVDVDESILVHLPSGAKRRVSVQTVVYLTWHRRGAYRTSKNAFYIVPEGLLNSDVVLGSDESMERQHTTGFVSAEEIDQSVPLRAPTAPMYAQSSLQRPPEVQRTYDRVSAMREAQLMRASEPPAQAAQSAPVNDGQPSHATLPAAGPAATGGQLQLKGLWGTTPISISFNPEESGETFFQVFLRWAKRRGRGGEVDRSRMILWLKANKEMSDDAAQDLSLDLDELENLWATTVAWIHENKSAQAPHLYATVQMIEMEDG